LGKPGDLLHVEEQVVSKEAPPGRLDAGNSRSVAHGWSWPMK
jgi:hypothetical protein